ncbi:MAG: hypothetical protein GX368_03420 [Erysipelotrichaceae bacterium]|nr:hypothetical protein [Erysipelotrichaceae bacterium]
MIETFNDVLSLAVIGSIVLACIYYVYSTFSKHHARKIMEFESEYYEFDDETSTDDFYI